MEQNRRLSGPERRQRGAATPTRGQKVKIREKLTLTDQPGHTMEDAFTIPTREEPTQSRPQVRDAMDQPTETKQTAALAH